MSDYKAESLAFLRHLIAETGKKPTELARLAEVSQTTLTRPLNSEDHKYAVKFQTLQRLAERTGVPLPPTLVAARKEGLGAPPAELDLPIRYKVAGGGFLRRDDLPQQPYGHRPTAPIPPYEFHEQWLELVVGDSMNRLIPDGALVHVVNVIGDQTYRPRHGQIVIVERTAAQGSLVERTMKQVELTPDGIELWPRSHSPEWREPVALGGDGPEDDVGVEIVGLVLRAYIDTFQF